MKTNSNTVNKKNKNNQIQMLSIVLLIKKGKEKALQGKLLRK